MKPTVGRIVLYHTTAEERKAMEDSFNTSGKSQNVASILPAIVVAVWSEVCINIKVFVDGIGELWITSANEVNPKLIGNNGYSVEGKWSWPEILKSEKKEAVTPDDFGLELYIGTKTIGAKPMNLGDYNDYRGWIIPTNEDPMREGFLVVYPDGYKSWSPKEVFEAAYDKLLVLPDGTNYIDEATVFPSEVKTIASKPDADYPGGAHLYQFKNSIGFNNGEAQYHDSYQKIQFVQKNLDGTMIPGLQSEQLVLALLDRAKKLNTRFPSEQNAKMCEGLQIFLDACKERVQDRINRGVMGDHKK